MYMCSGRTSSTKAFVHHAGGQSQSLKFLLQWLGNEPYYVIKIKKFLFTDRPRLTTPVDDKIIRPLHMDECKNLTVLSFFSSLSDYIQDF